MKKVKDINDLAAKDFVSFPDVSADIINVWQHQGEKVLAAEQIMSAPTETFYQGADALHNQLEDVAKYKLVDGKVNAVYLFANQTKDDEGMLLRKAGYVGGFYREQYQGKTHEISPVMELVLYWGKNRWKSSRSMKELFRHKEIPLETWKYIDDLKLHLWEMRYLPKEVRGQFTSDMRIVVDYLAEGEGYTSHQKVVHKEALMKLLRVLSGETNVDDTAEVLKEMNVKEEDDIVMCELFEQYGRRGRQEGLKEGIKEGIKEGLKEGLKALIITCKELGVSFDETAERIRTAFSLPDDEVQENMKLYW